MVRVERNPSYFQPLTHMSISSYLTSWGEVPLKTTLHQRSIWMLSMVRQKKPLKCCFLSHPCFQNYLCVYLWSLPEKFMEYDIFIPKWRSQNHCHLNLFIESATVSISASRVQGSQESYWASKRTKEPGCKFQQQCKLSHQTKTSS